MVFMFFPAVIFQNSQDIMLLDHGYLLAGNRKAKGTIFFPICFSTGSLVMDLDL